MYAIDAAVLKAVAVATQFKDAPPDGAAITCRVDTAEETVNLSLSRLRENGLIDGFADNQTSVSVTDDGRRALLDEYDEYRRAVGPSDVLTLFGQVTSGLGNGEFFVSLDGYCEQFKSRLGYNPYPGTLIFI